MEGLFFVAWGVGCVRLGETGNILGFQGPPGGGGVGIMITYDKGIFMTGKILTGGTKCKTIFDGISEI